MVLKTSEKSLDTVIGEMIDVVENGKDEIFHISEVARADYEELEKELAETKENVIRYIEDGDRLQKEVQSSRQRLSEVSKYFDRYSESEIRKTYERTYQLQTKLEVLREGEKVLRGRRDNIERRLISLDKTIERAEGLAGKTSVILNYLNDDFKQVNEMIEEAKEKQEFGLKIIEAQEEERRKISREIHDGPAQMLANILLRSELVDRTFREGSAEDALKEIKSVRGMIRSSLYEVRRIIYDLRPMALDDLGLVPTLKKYLAKIKDNHEIQTEFITLGIEKRLNQKYEIAIFRLVQEAVQNTIKHAEATTIKVKMEMDTEYLTVSVKDNGKGFDAANKKDNSFGLVGMRERVEMIGGTIKINSATDSGAIILIHIPFNKR